VQSSTFGVLLSLLPVLRVLQSILFCKTIFLNWQQKRLEIEEAILGHFRLVCGGEGVKEAVLKLAPFPHPHSAERLRALSFGVLQEFGVKEENVVKIVGDCAPTNKAAFCYTMLLASHSFSRTFCP